MLAETIIVFRLLDNYITANNWWKEASQISVPLPNNRSFPIPFLLFQNEKSDLPYIATRTTLSNRHVVAVSSGFLSLNESSQCFVLLHENGHMYHQDPYLSILADLVSLVISRIFFHSSFLAWLFMNAISQICIGTIAERRADSFAIQHASQQELEGGISILKLKQITRIQRWQSASRFLQKLSLAIADFIYYIWQGHPIETSRIDSIQQEIQRRNHLKANLTLPIMTHHEKA